MTATQHDTLTGTFRYAAKHQPIKHDASSVRHNESSVRHNESSVKLYTNDKV